MKIIFFTSLLLNVYTYILYPLILGMLNCVPFLKKKHLIEESKKSPLISLLISVYDEEKVIEEKIKNCLSMDYPKERMQILFGSDGSTDRTAEIIKHYCKENTNLFLYEFEKRQGKPATINKIVKSAQGEILLFSDADTFLEKDALIKIAAAFSDKSVGCICGNMILTCDKQEVSSEGVYWKYELWLKEMESNLGSVIGVSGGLYALRKYLWEDIPNNTLIDDFVIAMNVTEKGQRSIYEPAVLAYEKTGCTTKQEFIRRVRIGAGDFQSIFLLRRFLNPLRGMISWEFWSHKVIRWCGPFLFIAAYLTNIYLLPEGPAYFYIFLFQSLFYLAGILGWLLRDRGPRIFSAIYYFIVMNFALLVGFFYYIFCLQEVTWKKAEK